MPCIFVYISNVKKGGFEFGGKEESLNHCLQKSVMNRLYFRKMSVTVMESCSIVPLVPRSPDKVLIASISRGQSSTEDDRVVVE